MGERHEHQRCRADMPCDNEGVHTFCGAWGEMWWAHGNTRMPGVAAQAPNRTARLTARRRPACPLALPASPPAPPLTGGVQRGPGHQLLSGLVDPGAQLGHVGVKVGLVDALAWTPADGANEQILPWPVALHKQGPPLQEQGAQQDGVLSMPARHDAAGIPAQLPGVLGDTCDLSCPPHLSPRHWLGRKSGALPAHTQAEMHAVSGAQWQNAPPPLQGCWQAAYALGFAAGPGRHAHRCKSGCWRGR